MARPTDLTKTSVYDIDVEREINYYVSMPETIIEVVEPDFDKLFKDTIWSTTQMGYQITFNYLPNAILETLWGNQGIPTISNQDTSNVDFSIKSIFNSWFLFLVSEQIIVDSFSIYKIGLNNIEFITSMIPMTIKSLKRKE